MKAYVIGQPISHSLSPAIFRILADIERSSLNYTAREIAPENLEKFMDEARADEDFVGSNVTIPHKEAILKLADEATDAAKTLGAANVIQAGKKYKAHNTDVIGIEKTLLAQQFEIKDSNALILGAGGSARAVCYVLAKGLAKSVTVYNPRSDRGVQVCAYFSAQFPGIQFNAVSSLEPNTDLKIDLVVNCTPIGMKGEGPEFFHVLSKLTFNANALAFDLLYTPSKLPFLAVTQGLGLKTVNGLSMLIEQALATWEIWIGKLQHPAEVRTKIKISLEAILKSREHPKPIFLTGFMGVGKSTVARELSYVLDRNFIDTDRMIEDKAHSTIPEIFEKQGEPYFRSLESEAIQTATRSANCVIALGGGALNDEKNLKAVLQHGTLIYLRASEHTLYKRLKKRANQRPLLADLHDNDLKERIAELLKKRVPIYEQAHLKVEILAEDTPYDTAQTVMTHWERYK